MFCFGAAFTIVDIGSDIALAVEYWNYSKTGSWSPLENNMNFENNTIFAGLTTGWIVLSAVCQFFLVIYLKCRQDPRLIFLPPLVQFLLFLWTPICLGPVVIYLHGASLLICRRNIVSIQKDVTR